MTSRILPLIAALGLTGCATEQLELQRDVTYIAEWIGDDAVIGRTPRLAHAERRPRLRQRGLQPLVRQLRA